MSFKKAWLFILILFLVMGSIFAEADNDIQADTEVETVQVDKNTTQISIENADTVYASEDLVVLNGNVVLSFQTLDSSKKSLKADKVVVELDKKKIEASGNVSLEDTQQGSKSFSGESVIFDWSNLDVVVFSGVSYTERKNAKGATVSLYASGQTVSYAGNENIVFFNNGQIATVKEDPYWSINASKISFSESDVFVDNAVMKLGRVPIFYLPIFFYPGTTLSFNPAIGLASDKGAFLNTTTELYGVYIGIGTSSSNNSGSSDTASSVSDYSASLLSLLDDGESSEKIRDGVYYRSVKEGEDLGALETWARKTGSYFAIFADVYEKLGLAVGYDTSNSFFDSLLKVNSTGILAYNASDNTSFAKKTRYYINLGLQFKFSSGSLTLSLPSFSDYTVKSDFLNRNTVFGLDSIFGASQDFPSNYSSSKSYSWTLNGNVSYKLGNVSLNLSTLKAEINFDLVSSYSNGKYTYTPKVSSASLPTVNFSSNGYWSHTFSAKKVPSEASENEATEELQPETTKLSLSPYDAPQVKTEQKTSSDGLIKFGYTVSESLENKYKDELKPSSFYSNTTGTLYVEGNSTNSWFAFNETLKPHYTFSAENLSSTTNTQTKINEATLNSSLVLKAPFLGLTYRLSSKIYSLNTKEVGSNNASTNASTNANTYTSTEDWVKWDKSHITEHSLEFSKSLGFFTFGLIGTFKPVTQSVKPSLGFKTGNFSASLDMTFTELDSSLKSDTGNLALSYSSSNFSFGVKNTYVFKNYEDDFWAPYALTQNASLNLFAGKLAISENSSFKSKFEPSYLSVSVSHTADLSWINSKGSCSLSFKGTDGTLNKEVLKLSLNNDLQPIYFWKNRIGFEFSVDFSFVYNFINPYNTSFSVDFSLAFEIAEFLALNVSVNSSNKSFYRYFKDGQFDYNLMLEDLLKSFDFFGNGRNSTGFNLNSYKIELIHYMRDWDACLSAEGKLSARNDGKLVWSPVYKFYVKWKAIPELKVEKTIDKNKEE